MHASTEPNGSTPPRVQLKRKVTPRVGPGYEPASPVSGAEARESGEDTVRMVFPRAMILTDDQHKRVSFGPGVQDVPAHLAGHWYLQASGVSTLEPAGDASEE